LKIWASLWSADPLALGAAIDLLDGHVDGFHLDVIDGRVAEELLHGPSLVRAIRARARESLVDVHLLVSDPDCWLENYAAAGADLITVDGRSCRDVVASLSAIEGLGVRPGLAVTLDEPVRPVVELLERVDRLLVMGTELGVKGVELAEITYERVREAAHLRTGCKRRPEIVVDGGIRTATVPRLARAGADGVVPGSLIFDQPDWSRPIAWLRSLATSTSSAV
jgi:ribulose-phosphate 3-epimerase